MDYSSSGPTRTTQENMVLTFLSPCRASIPISSLLHATPVIQPQQVPKADDSHSPNQDSTHSLRRRKTSSANSAWALPERRRPWRKYVSRSSRRAPTSTTSSHCCTYPMDKVLMYCLCGANYLHFTDQIDIKTQEIKASSDETYTDMLELADELPDSSPRYILLSYPLTLVWLSPCSDTRSPNLGSNFVGQL